MPRYAAFLRGVSPMNLKMPELKKSLEAAGFTEVKTLLSSGNVVFTAKKASVPSLEKKVEAALEKGVGRSFLTIIRSLDELQELLDADPFATLEKRPNAKKVVTFLRSEPTTKTLPPERDGARMLAMRGRDVLSAYTPTPKGPTFMAVILDRLGKDVTTRTWDTVKKTAAAAAAAG